jgi:hypothetical protein
MSFGGTPRGSILIWGYAKGFSVYLGVRKYQKVENPCPDIDDGTHVNVV